ncbi:unnamed protein product, partial [Callosobruchus maculatus]
MVRSTCQLRLFRRPEKNHIYLCSSIRPTWRTTIGPFKKKGTGSWCFHDIWISIRSQKIANR